MKKQSTYKNWDFKDDGDIWKIEKGNYPTLKWQENNSNSIFSDGLPEGLYL